MILDSPLKTRDDIQQLNKLPIPKTKGNKVSSAKTIITDTINPIEPIHRKTFPAKVSDFEMLISSVTGDIALSSSKRFSNPESSFIFLILY